MALLRTNCNARAASCNGALDRRLNARKLRLPGVAIVDRDHRDASRKALGHIVADNALVPRDPSAAMNVKEQRRGLSGLGLPEIEHLALMIAIVDIRHRRLG